MDLLCFVGNQSLLKGPKMSAVRVSFVCKPSITLQFRQWGNFFIGNTTIFFLRLTQQTMWWFPESIVRCLTPDASLWIKPAYYKARPIQLYSPLHTSQQFNVLYWNREYRKVEITRLHLKSAEVQVRNTRNTSLEMKPVQLKSWDDKK